MSSGLHTEDALYELATVAREEQVTISDVAALIVEKGGL